MKDMIEDIVLNFYFNIVELMPFLSTEYSNFLCFILTKYLSVDYKRRWNRIAQSLYICNTLMTLNHIELVLSVFQF